MIASPLNHRHNRILIIDDDRAIHLTNKYLLKNRYEIMSAYTTDEATVILHNNKIDVVLLDLNLKEENDGLTLIPQIRSIDPEIDIIMVSGSTEIELAMKALELGASSYLLKEHRAEQLIIAIESIVKQRRLIAENQHHARARKRLLEKSQIIGRSPAILKLTQDIEKIKLSKANVLIFAETGCGKELVARHIGASGAAPFIAVDSSTITSSMAESILFGHEKGAFTGAHTQNKGLFEEADGGTIYFDEIANMPLDIQSKLLRVIEEKEVTRLGSARVIPLNFRVICATNCDLEELAKQGKFKYDLFQRLNVISLHIPPLKDRKEDLPYLLDHFFKIHFTDSLPRILAPDALEILTQYDWPGNIRELSNIVASIATLSGNKTIINVEDLPPRLFKSMSRDILNNVVAASAASTPEATIESIVAELTQNEDFYVSMHKLEGKVLSNYYKQYGGNISQMSKTLKISRSHLYSKLQSHGLHI